MLENNQIEAEALRLHKAEQERKQITATSLRHPQMDVDDAYAIQKIWVDKKISAGEKIIGHKIGLTSKAMQTAMRIDEPDYGILLNSMHYEHDTDIDANDFLDPRIEAELAFILKKPLAGDTLSIDDVLNATDYVVPALEIIAARTHRIDPNTGYARTIKDTIADNAANAGLICSHTKIDPHTTDLCWVGALLYKNNEIEESGISAAVLGHPARGIAWLAKKYHKHGITLEPGHIVLAGSFTRPVKVSSGDVIKANYGAYGEIIARFT